ncbi:phosphotransferase [bacterium LRH843]|nr:phosphotransferase [bacterium LRH843]
MIDINNKDALHKYVVQKGLISGEDDFDHEELSGGVSCKVIKITTQTQRFVLKQALPKLKVKDEWFSDIKRIFIERDCLIAFNEMIPQYVPGFIDHDDNNYLFIMEAAPEKAESWKHQLLNGQLDVKIANKIATALAHIHSKGARSDQLKETFKSRQFFKELRISPYLETIQGKHPSIQSEIDHVIKMLLDNRITLVHGDYSPKNILVAEEDVYILDYEVAHIGHPSFDIAFLTNHLLLKAIKNKHLVHEYMNLMLYFIETYFSTIDFMDRVQLEKDTIRVLALLFLARVDGKSPADYITEEEDKEMIREISFQMLKSANSYKDVSTLLLQLTQLNEKEKGV